MLGEEVYRQHEEGPGGISPVEDAPLKIRLAVQNSGMKMVSLHWRNKEIFSRTVWANSKIAMFGRLSHSKLKSCNIFKMASSLGSCNTPP